MAQYVLQPVGHDPYDATPVNGDPFGMVETPGALPLTSQDQASRMVEQGTRALTPLADSLGSAASLLGRALYGPEAAGWDRYGPARPEEALNAAGWVTMPGLGRAAVALPAERGLGEVLSSGGIKPPAVPAPAPEGLGPSLTAYHGSPHDFDKFDISKIGTGEGVQAYGHGLYFAGNEGVARSYRNMEHPALGPDPRNDVTSLRQTWQTEGSNKDMTPETAADLMRGFPSLRASADNPDIARNVARYVNGQEPGGTVSAEAMYALRALDKQLPPAPVGKMYQVAIHADPEDFLDWDKPVSGQSQKVQAALAPFYEQPTIQPIGENPNLGVHLSDLRIGKASLGAFDTSKLPTDPAELKQFAMQHDPRTGGSIYESSKLVPGEYRDPAAATQALRDAGIPGIKYLDAGSRGKGDGTRNYVTFSDDIISILKKYGLAGLGIGTGAAAMQGQPDQSQ